MVEHLDHLARLGVAGIRVKRAEDFEGLAGLIMPGGESTCLQKLLEIFGLDTVIKREHQRGLKIWGTCAGAILLAREVVDEGPKLGLIDIRIARNAFGSQLDSFATHARVPQVAGDVELPLTFIRAPKILSVGQGVKILLKQNDYIAAAESDDVLVTVFHPELTPCLAFHRYFAHKCGVETPTIDNDPTWQMTSWTRFTRVT